MWSFHIVINKIPESNTTKQIQYRLIYIRNQQSLWKDICKSGML